MGIAMKIWRKRMTVIVLSTCLFLSGCAKTEIIGGSVEHDKLVDGVYEGSYKGGPNKAVVKVTIEKQKIVKIEIVEHDAWKGKKAEPIIPQRIIDRPPSAELRPDQKDEDSLGPYAVLDPILEAYVEEDRSLEEIVALG